MADAAAHAQADTWSFAGADAAPDAASNYEQRHDRQQNKNGA